MKIAMIGCGYVDLVSSACFTDFRLKVTCACVDKDKISRLERNQIPIGGWK